MKVNLHANDDNSAVEETIETTEEKSLPDVETNEEKAQDHVNVSFNLQKKLNLSYFSSELYIYVYIYIFYIQILV